MTSLPTVKVKNPDDPDGGFMVINKSDFQEGVHELFDEKAEKSQKKASKGNAEGEKKNPPAEFPEGYSAKHIAGGRFELTGPEGQLIEGPVNGKWQGKETALEAAKQHAAAAAAKT